MGCNAVKSIENTSQPTFECGLHSCFLFVSFFHPEDGGYVFSKKNLLILSGLRIIVF
jgi:hypothetical protein